MTQREPAREHLAALAGHLADRRDAILQAWSAAVEADPALATASSLSRAQFHDHIPAVLDAFEARLRAAAHPDDAKAEDEAAAHGRQRWQQGYHLREVAREWGHLHLVVLDEVERYAVSRPDAEPAAMATARRALAVLCADGVSESSAAYYDLRKAEAAGNARDLEQALAEVQEAERRAGEVWREVAHDLRGNLGVVRNATFVLGQEGLPESARANSTALLQRSVASLHALLEDVLHLARLQAGQDPRRLAEFDAAAELADLAECLRPLAQERGLTLTADGPAPFPVEGDPVKIRRVAQNLLLNALKYTPSGGVTLAWGDSRSNDPKRWMITVADTGPGMPTGSAAPLKRALEHATETAQEVDPAAAPAAPPPASAAPTPPRPGHPERGEGVGLSIVKRLCEVLDAAIELESEPGVGTTFRIVLPRAYDKPSVK